MKIQPPEDHISRFKSGFLSASVSFIILLIISTVLLPCNSFANGSGNDKPIFKLTPIAGYRVDTVDFALSNPGIENSGNFSELEFNTLEIFQMGIDTAMTLEPLHFKASYLYGRIFNGNGVDSDFSPSGGGPLFSQSTMDIHDDSTVDFNAGLGVRFHLTGSVVLDPFIGFSIHEQNLRLTNGFSFIPTGGPFSGLNSTYRTCWETLWMGIVLKITLGNRLALFIEPEYHIADYKAEANWNLRKTLRHPTSFTHDADGKGFVVTIGSDYLINRTCSLDLRYKYQEWSTAPGEDLLFFNNGRVGVSRLTEVNWRSRSISVGLRLTF